ncbi:MAG: hypothetical protein ACE5KY_05445 [Candidatus Tectimicrobiota bacterium]
MSEKLLDRLKQVLDRKLFGMSEEQREAERTASMAFMKQQFAKKALDDTFNVLRQNAAGITYTIESKLVDRKKAFERPGEERFTITLGTVRATVERKDDHLLATITKGDPPDETRVLTFPARVREDSIILSRADSPMSIYPDDVLGDVLEAMIELVD